MEVKHQQAEIKAKHDWLVHKASLLRRGKIDPDMLDERARAILNLAHPGDLIMMNRRPPDPTGPLVKR